MTNGKLKEERIISEERKDNKDGRKEKEKTKKMNGAMDYCIECNEFTQYTFTREEKTENYRGKDYTYYIETPRCNICNSIMPLKGQIDRETEEFFKVYKRTEGIIDIEEIEDILHKYNIGKEPLALALGFGKVTIKRYFDGQFPSKQNSNIMFKALNSIDFMEECIENNKKEIGQTAYKKTKEQIVKLRQIKNSKLEQVANYIINQSRDITPLTLQKLLYFVQGISSLINGKLMFNDMCQAWAHGPVYPVIYNRYKEYCADEIKPVADTSELKDLISNEDEKVIQIVMNTFGLYSGKILVFISHEQNPWKDARGGCALGEKCDNYIKNEAIVEYYKSLNINTEVKVREYVMQMVYNYI